MSLIDKNHNYSMEDIVDLGRQIIDVSLGVREEIEITGKAPISMVMYLVDLIELKEWVIKLHR